MIKTFDEFWEESGLEFTSEYHKGNFRDAYETALKESKSHYEIEKISLHDYYDKHIKMLMGNDNVFEGSEENGGKLT